MEFPVKIHYERSASSAHRWMHCAGSVNAQRGLPAGDTTFADEGTRAHACAERILRGLSVSEFPDDMISHAHTYVDSVRELAQGHPIEVELELPISHLTGEEGATSTADAVVLRTDIKRINIHDLKYGYNEIVAKDNEQAILYALMVLDAYDPEGVIYGVETVGVYMHQPRVRYAPSEWILTRDELNAYRPEILSASMATLDPNAPRTPGAKQCKYCRAKPCAEAIAAVTSECADMFVNHEETPKDVAGRADIVSLAELVKKADFIRDVIKAAESRIYARLIDRQPVPGFKLKLGRKGDREWSPEAENKLISLGLKDVAYTSRLRTPADLEKIIGKKDQRWIEIKECIRQAPAKPILTVAEDTATEYVPEDVSLFTNLDHEELIG